VSAQVISNNWLFIVFAGLPGEQYWVQGSQTLTVPNWENLVSVVSPNPVTANGNGAIQFIDTEAANYPNRFYRTTPYRP